MQKRPETHAILTGRDHYQWNDQKWQRAKQKQSFENSPMNVYEVHLGSWRKGEEEFYNYRELAPQLSAYCKEMGYTHIEILPITEHPLDESWGYQVTGFYTPTSRYGSLEDFQFFVDYFHQEGLGIILDWVPAHFPIDDYSLARFDGTYLFEHEDPRQGYHPHWNTLIFNYGKPEVVNFLIGSALFWLKKMHVDGLRVDAVASMLYLDYGRNEGEWLPNKWGGNENLEAIAFLKQLNLAVKEECCGVIMIAEESTTFPKITKAVAEGGLGFDMKWNLGWMNDSLRYFAKDPIYRKFHHKELCHTFSYAFAEKSMLVLSHDEVVHEKKSLFAKMPGDPWYKFANLRLLLGFMMCHPGKKLLFMGGELGQIHEWFCKEQLSWEVLKRQDHFDHFTFVKKLNHFYLKTPALWEQDFDPNSFAWLDNDDAENSVLSFFRKGKYNQIICVFNFTPVKRANYIIRMPPLSSLKEIFSSHSHKKNCAESPCDGKKSSKDKEVVIELDPLAFHIFEVNFD
jgi:1,4-alpha-glucan branching enzyme